MSRTTSAVHRRLHEESAHSTARTAPHLSTPPPQQQLSLHPLKPTTPAGFSVLRGICLV